MNKNLILSLIGPDNVGIVDQVSKIVLNYNGNVDESRMARLGGEFAMLVLISVEITKTNELENALIKLKNDGFQIVIKETEPKQSTKYKGWLPYQITVSGADHEGIINEITHYIAEKGINIESMETHTTAAPMSGTLLFTMTAIILTPPKITFHNWVDRMDELGDSLNVNIEVSPYKG